MTFTTTDKCKALEREIALRRRVYPNRILTRRMKQEEAERQIAIFEEILREYQDKEKAEQLL